MDTTLLLIGVSVILLCWGIVGFHWLSNIFQEDPAHEETLVEIIKAGPFAWIMWSAVALCRFVTIKK